MSYKGTFGVNWNLLERSHKTHSRLLTLPVLSCQKRAICPSVAQWRALQTARLPPLWFPPWQGDACQVERGAAEIPGQSVRFSDSAEKFATGNCRVLSSVGGDNGDHWSSYRLTLQDFELISPPAKQSIHSIPRIIRRLFCTKEVSQKPSNQHGILSLGQYRRWIWWTQEYIMKERVFWHPNSK